MLKDIKGYSTKYFSSNSEKKAMSKLKELNIHLRQLRFIKRKLFLELTACKELLDEQKRENQLRYKKQNNGKISFRA